MTSDERAASGARSHSQEAPTGLLHGARRGSAMAALASKPVEMRSLSSSASASASAGASTVNAPGASSAPQNSIFFSRDSSFNTPKQQQQQRLYGTEHGAEHEQERLHEALLRRGQLSAAKETDEDMFGRSYTSGSSGHTSGDTSVVGSAVGSAAGSAMLTHSYLSTASHEDGDDVNGEGLSFGKASKKYGHTMDSALSDPLVQNEHP